MPNTEKQRVANLLKDAGLLCWMNLGGLLCNQVAFLHGRGLNFQGALAAFDACILSIFGYTSEQYGTFTDEGCIEPAGATCRWPSQWQNRVRLFRAFPLLTGRSDTWYDRMVWRRGACHRSDRTIPANTPTRKGLCDH